MRTLLWAILMLMLPAAICADIGLNQQVSFTVPQLTHSIRVWDLDDIDHDGSPEILACDSARLVLYSYQLGSVVWTTPVPAGYYNLRVLLADVNRDNVADVVIGGYFDSTLTRQYRVRAWDGAAGYTTSKVSKYARTDSFTGLPLAGLVTLQALDINADGYNELLVSYDSMYTGTMTDYTPGNTFLYYSFPDSVSWKRYRVTAGVMPWVPRNDTATFIYGEYYAYYSQLSNDYTYTLQTPHTCLADGATMKAFDTQHVGSCNTWSYLYSREDRVTLECRGDINTATLGDEALLYYDYAYQCDFAGAMGARLEARQIISADSLAPLWSVNLTADRYSSFTYFPGFPGMFFAIDNVQKRIARFNGATGGVLETSAVLPTGSYHWVMSADSTLKLMVVNNDDVAFYTMDEATDVGGGGDGALPRSFTLRDPYPNPFNPTTTLSLSLPKRGELTVEVFDLLGRKVTTLHEGVVAAGENSVTWEAHTVSSGVYFIRAQFDGDSQTVKAMLLK